MNDYLKIPCEMALFALTERQTSKVACYLASQFIYSGNAHCSDKPVQKIASTLHACDKTVYNSFDWLLNRNWFGRNKYGRYYFRGIDRVHQIEGWTFARAAIMQNKDFQNFKAFMAGVVFASLAETGKGKRREQSSTRRTNRSTPSASPISLSVIADTFQVSVSSAYRIRKLADKCNYIKNDQTLIQITNFIPNDLKHMKAQNIDSVPLELLGYADRKIKPIDRIRYRKNKLYLQEPNLVQPLISLKSRRGLSQYKL